MAAANSWYEEIDDDEDKAVKDIIRSTIRQNDHSTFLEAGQKLDKLAVERGSPEGIIAFINGLLPDIFIKAASLTPHDSSEQDNLVAFLASLQRLPRPEWRDLFGYGFTYNLSEVNDGKYQ